jgi:hypothetical protein
MHEVNFLANKAVEVEALEKQRKIDQEDRMMEKFKLIRINESLQGKLERIENTKGGKEQSSRREHLSRETGKQIGMERDTVTRRETVMESETVIKSDIVMKSLTKIGK